MGRVQICYFKPSLPVILPIIRVSAGQESSQTSKNNFCGYGIVFKGKNNKKNRTGANRSVF